MAPFDDDSCVEVLLCGFYFDFKDSISLALLIISIIWINSIPFGFGSQTYLDSKGFGWHFESWILHLNKKVTF